MLECSISREEACARRSRRPSRRWSPVSSSPLRTDPAVGAGAGPPRDTPSRVRPCARQPTTSYVARARCRRPVSFGTEGRTGGRTWRRTPRARGTGRAAARAAHRRPAVRTGAEPLALGHLRPLHHRRTRIGPGDVRHLHQARRPASRGPRPRTSSRRNAPRPNGRWRPRTATATAGRRPNGARSTNGTTTGRRHGSRNAARSCPGRSPGRPPRGDPGRRRGTMPVGETTGARPQVSQYSSTAAHVLVVALARGALALRTHRDSPCPPAPRPSCGASGRCGCNNSATACW
ncbi:hypothetical protein SBADM41S_10105 [Streptomyces badius]